MTWLYTRTGSLLIPMLAHLFSNLTMAFSRVLVAESQLDRYWLDRDARRGGGGRGILVATKGRLNPCSR